MKQAMINYRQDWTFWLPDSVANWDAISHWERERLASMERWLQPGMVLYDIGTEHGWLSAVYGSFCGHGSMVLVEPSPEFWPNIRLTWQHNGFTGPLGCYVAFAGEQLDGEPFSDVWPAESDGDEIGAMAYRYIGQHSGIPTVTVDWLAAQAPPMAPPDAITVDVEGAELLVMRGAADTLDDHRPPFVWISIHPDLMERDFGHTPDMLHEFMADHGYHGKLLGIDHEEHHLFRPAKR